jgi:transmembrane sensor
MAAFWMARKMSGSMNAEERRNFDQWLGDDPANRAAFAELEHIMSLADLADSDLLAEEFERDLGQLARDDAARTQRFTAIAASFLLAAIAVTGALFLKNAGRPEAAVYATAVGVARQVNLDDGTQIDLNTDSRIEVAYTKSKRAVSLAGGQAFFNVEPDRDRPFVIDSGGAQITVTGTSFDVSAFDGVVTVSVLSGAVDVKSQFGAGAVLLAGDQISVDAAGAAGAIVRFDPGVVFAWRGGKARFKERALGEVIAELNRYFETPIALANPDLAALPVTGEFDIRDQDAAVRALALSFDLNTHEEPARVLLTPRTQ